MALVCVFGASCAIVCMRYMKDGIHYAISPFYFAVGCSIMSPLMYVIMQNPKSHSPKPIFTTRIDNYTIFLLIIESLISFLGQNFNSRAYQLEKAVVITPLSYIQFVVAILFDIIFQKTVI